MDSVVTKLALLAIVALGVSIRFWLTFRRDPEEREYPARPPGRRR